ncbi:MAG: hypothetical protein E5Y79_16170 [Mesorhizobium sp.]|uniref:hypothetical protein n=1 Tax=Mesorhizobium sp. TaxID=1871066 RepID=UPI0012200D4B|nr:hypothetical protein [Mesorhizobium sp.]TIL59270.1 MAG: hypothetical protein E5Y79_16170 [Mesorhizobium sp.]TIL84226.1 MAG: hypothetical protein E5Y73_34400 [Mesorhizobium sp.]
MNINRRSVIGALGAIPAAAVPGHALGLSEAPADLQQLLDAHEAACAAKDASYETYRRLDQAFDGERRDDAEERAMRAAAGLWAAEEKLGGAEKAEDQALEEILSYRPTNMGEIAAKALYLASVIDRGGHLADAVDTDRAQRFLRSLAA